MSEADDHETLHEMESDLVKATPEQQEELHRAGRMVAKVFDFYIEHLAEEVAKGHPVCFNAQLNSLVSDLIVIRMEPMSCMDAVQHAEAIRLARYYGSTQPVRLALLKQEAEGA